MKLCWICGTAPDGTEFPSTAPVPPPIKLPTLREVVSAAGVPRRFGLQKVMVMTAVYAVLFAVMAALGVHPIVFVAIAVFFTGVAASQALLFGGKDPRRASMVTGLMLCPMVILGSVFVLQEWWNVYIDLRAEFTYVFLGLVFGAPLGYMAGAFSAAVFLVRECEPDKKTNEGLDDDPFAPAVAEVAPEDPTAQEAPDGDE